MAHSKDQLSSELTGHVELGHWAKAVQALQGLLELEPTKTNYYLRAGDYSLKAGNKAAAIGFYYQAAKLYVEVGFSAKGIATYKMILRIAPEESEASSLMKASTAEANTTCSEVCWKPAAPKPRPARKGDMRERLKRAIARQRNKANQLMATKAQLVMYAKDLKRSIDREHKKTEELKAANHQMLKYVGDLKESLKISRRQAKELDETCRGTIIALSRAIEARDPYTAFHTDRVTAYALQIAKRIGWSKGKLSILELGGHIHDIGKLAVLDSILNKSGRLTPEEFQEMQKHPLRGAEIVRDIRFLKPMVPYILYHHEQYDGTGYPGGLKGEAIPEEGRLLAVADAFDAMTSSRSYRAAMPIERAIQELKGGAGTHFDPAFVEAFLEVWETGALEPILVLGRDGQGLSFGRKDTLEKESVLVQA